MIYKRFSESSVDDIVTDKRLYDDLDEIENNVMASHDDEVEDAMKGIVGDPVEETFMHIYESEYNYNQLLEAVGMYKVNALANGRHPVLEGVDIKALLGNVKRIIISTWNKFVETFQNIFEAIVTAFSNNKKFVEKHDKDIKAGFDKIDGGENGPKGYKFNFDLVYTKGHNTAIGNPLDKVYKEDMEEIMAEISSMATGGVSKDCTSVADVRDELTKYITGDAKKVALKGTVYKSADDVIKALKNDGDSIVSQVKYLYKLVKTDNANYIKDLDKIGKGLDKYEEKMANLNEAIKVLRNEQNFMHTAVSVVTAFSRKAIIQHRSFANACVAKAGKKSNATTTNESSIFAGLTIL